MITVDRFQLIEQSQLQIPHKCSTCGGYSNRKFIDFGLYVEFYGNVYICDGCFLGAAKVVDCVPIANYDSAIQQIQEMQKVIAELITDNKGLRNAVDTLRRIDTIDHDRPVSNTVSDQGPADTISKDAPKSTEGSSESIDGSGSEDILSSLLDKPERDTITELGLNI